MRRMVIAFLLLYFALAGQDSNAAEKTVKVQVDVPKIALQSRSAVEQLLGKPLRVRQNSGWQSAEYAWGDLQYERAKVTGLTYRFAQPLPKTVDEALARIGLKKASAPSHAGTGNYQWSDIFGTALRCCGFEFDSIMLDNDFASIDISIKRRISGVRQKSFAEMTADEHLAFAEQILRRNPADLNRGNLDEAENHLNAIVSAKLAASKQTRVAALRTKIKRIDDDYVRRGLWLPR